MMSVFVVSPERFNAIAETTLNGARYMSNDNVCAALLTDRVVAFGLRQEKTREEMEKSVERMADEILGHHPDFEYLPLDNDAGVIMMSTAPFARWITPEEIQESGGKPSFAEMFAYRQEILEACEDPEIIAVYYLEED